MMTAVSTSPGVPPPPAVRARPPGWRDPRLWIGVALVAISVVAGARILGADDTSVVVWAVTDDAAPGTQLSEDDLVGRRVDFADAADQARYFASDDTLPAQLRLNRAVGAGELLPRSALADAGEDGRLQLPINLENGAVSKRLSAGAIVDVYVAGGKRCEQCRSAVLTEVPVTEVALADELGTRQVVLAVDQDQADAWFALIGTLSEPTITVAEVG
jgi:hypothetical protein